LLSSKQSTDSQDSRFFERFQKKRRLEITFVGESGSMGEKDSVGDNGNSLSQGDRGSSLS
jgi:hypothetical protein